MRGQYYVQAGRQLNVAFAPEIPSVGSVIASELESRRKEADTFPTYVSFNLSTNRSARFPRAFCRRGFRIRSESGRGVAGMTLDQKATELLEERWRLLSGLLAWRERGRMAGFGRTTAGFEDFSDDAAEASDRPAVAGDFPHHRRRAKTLRQYSVGISTVLARNLLKQNGGTHFIHITHNGWDHPSRHLEQAGEDEPLHSDQRDGSGAGRSDGGPERDAERGRRGRRCWMKRWWSAWESKGARRGR